MERRTVVTAIGALLAWPMLGRTAPARPRDMAQVEAMRRNWRALLPRDAGLSVSLEPVRHTADEWRALVGEAAYRILFEEGTEQPFSSPLNDEKRPGVFLCAACRLPLFTSAMKYDSGTGWPSFFTVIPGHVATKRDFRLIIPRTEYHCVRCGGHQGHVFDDGPPPTGERWCNNGLALAFLPRDT